MTKVITHRNGNGDSLKAEARQLRRTGKRIAASRTMALQLLAATGMYTIDGKLKPQFR